MWGTPVIQLFIGRNPERSRRIVSSFGFRVSSCAYCNLSFNWGIPVIQLFSYSVVQSEETLSVVEGSFQVSGFGSQVVSNETYRLCGSSSYSVVQFPLGFTFGCQGFSVGNCARPGPGYLAIANGFGFRASLRYAFLLFVA